MATPITDPFAGLLDKIIGSQTDTDSSEQLDTTNAVNQILTGSQTGNQATTGTTSATTNTSNTSKVNADISALQKVFAQQQAGVTPDMLASIFREGSKAVPGLVGTYANAVGARSSNNDPLATALGDLSNNLVSQAAQLNTKMLADSSGTAAQIANLTKSITDTGTQAQTGTQNQNVLNNQTTNQTQNTNQVQSSHKNSEVNTANTINSKSTGQLATAAILASLLKGGLGGAAGQIGSLLGGQSGIGSLLSSIFGGANGGFSFDPNGLPVIDQNSVLDLFGIEPGSSGWASDEDMESILDLFEFADGGRVPKKSELKRKYADGGNVMKAPVIKNPELKFNDAPKHPQTADLLKSVGEIGSGGLDIMSLLGPLIAAGNLSSGGGGGGPAPEVDMGGGNAESPGNAAPSGGYGNISGAAGLMGIASTVASLAGIPGAGVLGMVAKGMQTAVNNVNAGDSGGFSIGGLSDSGNVGLGNNAASEASGLGGEGFGGFGLGGLGLGMGTGIGVSDAGFSGFGMGSEGGESEGGDSGGTSGGAGDGTGGEGGGEGWANGGRIPRQSNDKLGVKDKINISVSGGEHIIPTDVVDIVGSDFFDNLIALFHVPAEMQKQAPGAK